MFSKTGCFSEKVMKEIDKAGPEYFRRQLVVSCPMAVRKVMELALNLKAYPLRDLLEDQAFVSGIAQIPLTGKDVIYQGTILSMADGLESGLLEREFLSMVKSKLQNRRLL